MEHANTRNGTIIPEFATEIPEAMEGSVVGRPASPDEELLGHLGASDDDEVPDLVGPSSNGEMALGGHETGDEWESDGSAVSARTLISSLNETVAARKQSQHTYRNEGKKEKQAALYPDLLKTVEEPV